MIKLRDDFNLTLAEMQRALRKANINPDPQTWTEDVMEKVGEVLNRAQQQKIERKLAQ
jgi:hypothetical protein